MLLLLPLVLATAAATAAEPTDCAATVPLDALATRLGAAEQTFAAADEPAFHTTIAALTAELPCLDAPVPSATVARLHRALGMEAFLTVQPERATRAFAAARRIEPEYAFPTRMAPVGGPLHKEYLAIDLAFRQTDALPVPAGERLLVDGQEVAERSRDWPAFVQTQSSAGQITLTRYLWPGEGLPILAALAPESLQPAAEALQPTLADAPTPEVHRGARAALWGGAGVAAVAAVASWAVASKAASDYRDNPHSVPELETLRAQANTWTLVAAGSGAAAVGAGLGAVLVARW